MSVDDTNPEAVEETMPETSFLDTLKTSYFRLFVATIDTKGDLAYKDQASENGPFAADFTTLATNFDLGPLAASTTMDGYVSVIAQQNDTQDILYYAESPSGGETRFADPVNLGMPAPVSAFQAAAAARGLDGLPNVFGVSDNDQSIWWRYQNTYTVGTETMEVIPPGTDTPISVTANVPQPPTEAWSDWVQIPGNLETVSSTNNADGRLVLVGLNADKVPYMNFQSGKDPFDPEQWKGWTDISGGLSGFNKITIAFDGNDFVYIFASIGSKIYMMAQTRTGADVFTGWVLLASFADTVSEFAVGLGANSGLYVAAQVGTGTDAPIYGMRQTQSDPAIWGAPTIIAHLTGAHTLDLHPQANRQLVLFALDVDSHDLRCIGQVLPDHWDANWTVLGSGIASFAVTTDITPNAG
ncbi:hypothetical protein [Cucumibacter marinus]|uniref:hypothetical protein n=1 Tax=Cucumibacter marinus TaxID=1121252 RepID=UPI0004175951|nr:hypothetical protein [Cucumibacter marinus]